MKVLYIYIAFILCLSMSCKVKNPDEAVIYSLNFINKNENAIRSITEDLIMVDSVNHIIILETKPGSTILSTSCDVCIASLSEETRMRIAYYIDALNLSYIKINRTGFVEFGFRFRNQFYNYYFIRNYDNLSDTMDFSKPYLRQYYLNGNWMLYSDEREEK